MDDGDSGSEYESDINISDTESEEDEELDEGIPMNRGPWFPVVDPGTFYLPEPNFHEQTGPVNFLPNSSILDYFLKFIDMPGRSVIDILVNETNRYATQCIAERSRPPKSSARGYQVVTELMTPHFNKEHHVTVDSFFTSPKLVHDLKDNGTFCTGTVIKTRRGMPKSYRNAKLQKGDMTVKYQGQLMAVLWADRRLVTILTTTGSACKINTTNSRGTDVAIPSAVKSYNYTMGGVDLGDQLLQFEPYFKSVKMWRKLLFNQLVTAAVNAFICYKRTFVVETKLDHLKFHQQLCQDLLGNHRDGTRNQHIRTVRPVHRQLARSQRGTSQRKYRTRNERNV
ncbi:unnamed protein product [Mytilus coruscus]|uniref:PiggyBac transposable element-derived protein domain-containing protein n=1 Tax=Mytilus coruscus TaxID=42192 RepID=A0A6J8CIQ5_MYTCO|nr:unnamed protein product [Mytilus coruscus]